LFLKLLSQQALLSISFDDAWLNSLVIKLSYGAIMLNNHKKRNPTRVLRFIAFMAISAGFYFKD